MKIKKGKGKQRSSSRVQPSYKREGTDYMTKWQKISLILLVVVTVGFIKVGFFSKSEAPIEDQAIQQEPLNKSKEEANENVPKSFVNVYFLGQNKKKEEVYKVVKREYDAQKDGTKLRFSIENLLKGPNSKEKAKGIYSEIPQGTKLLSLEESPDKIVINLSGDFEQGGGTDSLYKRLYQLIKTSNKNTAIEVYLYINGKQVDVVGGEGIMINQPLNSKSLDEG